MLEWHPARDDACLSLMHDVAPWPMVGGWPDQFSVTRWQKALSDVAFQVELESTYLRIARPRSYLVSSPRMSQNISAAKWEESDTYRYARRTARTREWARGSKSVSTDVRVAEVNMGRTGALRVFGIDGRR